MIRANFSVDRAQRELRMEVSGHAGAAKRGEDLICAGASMLARTGVPLISATNFSFLSSSSDTLSREARGWLSDTRTIIGAGRRGMRSMPLPLIGAMVMHMSISWFMSMYDISSTWLTLLELMRLM